MREANQPKDQDVLGQLFKDFEKEKLVRRYRKRFVLTAAGKKAKDEG